MSKPVPTHAIIHELFTRPPVNRAELAQRLKAAPPATTRRALLDRLARDEIEQGQEELFVEALALLKAGQQEWARLFALIQDRARSSRARATALRALVARAPELASELSARLPRTELQALAELPLADGLSRLHMEPKCATWITQVLRQVTEEAQPALVDRIEHNRLRVGLPASVAYADVLAQSDLIALRPRLLEVLVDEGTPSAVELLETLRDGAGSGPQRRNFQKALLELRTARLTATQPTDKARGHAYLGTCDGQGAFMLLGCFETKAGDLTLANLVIRAAADIRDGIVLPRQTDADLQDLLLHMRRETRHRLTRVSLEQAATFVQAGLARTQAMGRTLAVDARASVTLFELLRSEPLPCPSTATSMPLLSALRLLLDRPEYGAWFFDAGDLSGEHVPSPPNGDKQRARWMAHAHLRLGAARDIQGRLLHMLRHMTAWHALAEEPEHAASCAAATLEVETSFEGSAILTAMLEHTVEVLTQPLERVGRAQITNAADRARPQGLPR